MLTHSKTVAPTIPQVACPVPFRVMVLTLPVSTLFFLMTSARHYKILTGVSAAGLVSAILFAICVLLGGCGSVPPPSLVTGTPIALRGRVHGGQQPISHALIGLYAAGTSGPGSAATSLLSATVYTDSNGEFQLDGLYACPSPDAQILLTAQGGNPGLTSSTDNTGIAMMAALGPCAGLATAFVTLNEETTVAAVWALAPFMKSIADIGSSAGDPLFTDAVLQAQQLVDLASGTASGSALSDGYMVDFSKVYHLAGILNSCINTSGGRAGDTSPCGALFQAATPPGLSAPTDTVMAALAIARNPTRNVAALFNCVTPFTPFQPVLTAVPLDWTLGLVPVPVAPIISPRSGTYTTAQSVTLAHTAASAVLHYTLDGSQPTLASPVYTGPILISAPTVIMAAAVLGGMQSAPTRATVRINTAPAKLAFGHQPASAAAGAWLHPALTVQVLDANGKLSPGASGSVTLALAGSGSATLNGVTTQPIVNGVATFPHLSVSNPGTYTLTASDPEFTSTTSASFNVSPAPSNGEQATSALAFTDTVGINLHLGYDGTLYRTNFPLILHSLQDLGIHHVRDGLIDYGSGPSFYYTEYQELATQGIYADYITSIGQSEILMKAYPARVHGMEALEAPNEYDTSGDPNWPATLRAFLPVLRDAVHGSSPMDGVTLFGPSLVNLNWPSSTGNSYAQLGPVSNLFDAGNLHNYPGGRNPGTPGWTPQGYGSIVFAISAARQTSPTVPIVTTETGYWDDTATEEYVPDPVMSRYMPRVFLEQFLHGINRTYLYALADTTLPGDSYGLLRTDGTEKPAYLSLQALMHLLADNGAAYTPGKLDWSLSGAQSDLHHLLIAKRDGTFLLALWLEEPCWDVNAQTTLGVSSEPITVIFGVPVNVTSIDRWQPGGSMATTAMNTKSTTLRLTVSDLLTIVEIHP